MGGHLENIFSSAIGHLPREIFDLALKASIKLKNWKKHKGHLQERKNLNEKLISKWEINIKDECENTLRSGLRLYFSREDSYLPLPIALGYYLPGSSLNWAFLVRYFRTHRLHEIWLKTYVRDNVRCNIIKTLWRSNSQKRLVVVIVLIYAVPNPGPGRFGGCSVVVALFSGKLYFLIHPYTETACLGFSF